jgi:GTP-dependent phosphoenolpyruvate carboxykinase
MKKMPPRDTSGKCRGECRDRVFEGEQERQMAINHSNQRYDEPAEQSPSWTTKRNDPPGAMGGRV